MIGKPVVLHPNLKIIIECHLPSILVLVVSQAEISKKPVRCYWGLGQYSKYNTKNCRTVRVASTIEVHFLSCWITINRPVTGDR